MFVQMMNLGWSGPILRQGKIWSLMLLYWKRVKQWICQKLLWSAADVKVGRCSRVHEPS